MTFEGMMLKIIELGFFPKSEMFYFGLVLEESTKKKVLQYSPEEVGEFLKWTINEINNGSVETVDTLMNKVMNGNINKQ